MSARRKPQNLYPVKDLGQADQTIREIAGIKRRIEGINATLNDTIDRAKAEAETLIAPLATRLAGLENGLLAFAEYNKEDLFADRRSRELTYGELGYRRSTEIAAVPRGSMAQVLGKLHELGFEEGIRVNESVNKDVLRTWPDERLELVGARRVEKDTFWYEIKEEAVKTEA